MSDSVQFIYEIHEHQKTDLLIHLLQQPADLANHLDQVVVLLRTRDGVHALTTALHHAGFSVESIHGNKKAELRERAIKEFNNGDTRILVVTEASGRTIALSTVSNILQFEFHELDEDYLQRLESIKNNQGKLITFVNPKDLKLLQKLEKLVQENIPRKRDASFVYTDKPDSIKSGSKKNRKSSKERSKPLQHKKPKLINKNKPRRKTGRTSKR